MAAADPPASPSFPTTQWSLVVGAAPGSPEQAAAMEKLCGRYWYPVYAFIRRRGHDVHAAEDLTQGFFALLLARDAFNRFNPEVGRFRSFILASLNHFLRTEHLRSNALKRGGGQVILSIDEHSAEDLYQQDGGACTVPERQFDRHWAATLVRRVVGELRREQEQRGKADLFAGLQPWLTSEPDDGGQARLAAQLAMSQAAVRTALHRARRRFGELLRREVAHTVAHPDDINDELLHLLAAIAGE